MSNNTDNILEIYEKKLNFFLILYNVWLYEIETEIINKS